MQECILENGRRITWYKLRTIGVSLGGEYYVFHTIIRCSNPGFPGRNRIKSQQLEEIYDLSMQLNVTKKKLLKLP